jgi:hypothetical protein
MPSKKDRQKILSQIWATPTPVDVDFFDKGNEIVVTTSFKGDKTIWWLRVFKGISSTFLSSCKYLVTELSDTDCASDNSSMSALACSRIS